MLLSHSQIYSTIAAGALNCRVREGNVCVCSAMDAGNKIIKPEAADQLMILLLKNHQQTAAVK